MSNYYSTLYSALSLKGMAFLAFVRGISETAAII